MPSSRLRRHPSVGFAVVLVLVAAACSGDDGGGAAPTATTAASTTTAADGGGATSLPDLFDGDGLVEGVTEVDCTLENGTEATCWQIVVPSIPDTVAPGPFCPQTVEDDDSGIFTWDGDEPGLYALDAEFWSLMDGLGYDFSASDGSINVADPAGALPDGDACLEATPDDGYALATLFPVSPEDLDEPTELDTVAQVGVALDGVTIFGDAPSGTSGAIPALDPCGGHVDPSGYYHWHFGSTAIQANLDAEEVPRTCDEDQDEDALFGFAYDGHAIYGPHHDGDHPEGLDECSGHVADTPEFGETYHYHLTDESPNLPTCRVGATAQDKLTSPDNDAVSLPDSGGPGGGDAPGGVPGGPPPDGAGPPPGG